MKAVNSSYIKIEKSDECLPTIEIRPTKDGILSIVQQKSFIIILLFLQEEKERLYPHFQDRIIFR